MARTTVSQSIRTSRSHLTSAFATLTCVIQPAGNTPQLLCTRSARDRNAPQTSNSRNLLVGTLGTRLYSQPVAGALLQEAIDVLVILNALRALGGPEPFRPNKTEAEDYRDLRRVLYGLHAILSLHFAQEEELYTLFEA